VKYGKVKSHADIIGRVGAGETYPNSPDFTMSGKMLIFPVFGIHWY
jgi:hypothetical protein